MKETPKIVNSLLKTWIDSVENGKKEFPFKELKEVEDHGVLVSAYSLDGKPNNNNIFEILGELIHNIQLVEKKKVKTI